MKRYCVLGIALLLAFSSTTLAQQGRGRFGGGGVVGLLMIEEVRKELNITEDQLEKLRAARGDNEDSQNLSREERRQRAEEIGKKVDEAVKTVLDEKQQKRLSELRIQREGPSALARQEVGEKVGLDQSQTDQIKKIVEESQAGGNRIDFQNATDEERERFVRERREQREKTNSSILALLTSAQKETFEKLQGAKFNFPEPQRRRQQ